MYSAKLIAEYVIAKCSEANMPVSNSKLQNILYYIQTGFYNFTSGFLFSEDFWGGKYPVSFVYGPFVKEIYEDYKTYGASAIYPSSEYLFQTITSDVKELIDPIILEVRKASSGVIQQHLEKGIWEKFKDSPNLSVLPKELLAGDYHCISLNSKVIVYNKLVRDKIPDVITQAGDGVAKIRLLSSEDTRKELLNKLDEEKKEFMAEYDPEELADILEVVYGLAESINLSKEELEKIRVKKHNKRGGFSQGIFLESVASDNSLRQDK